MTRHLLAAAALALVAPAFLAAQNLVFSKIPLPSQLFQRDLATGQADVQVAGACAAASGYTAIELRLTDESGAAVSTVKKPLAYVGGQAAFDFSVKIAAGRNNHTIELLGQKATGGPFFLEKKVGKLLAGDIFIINGQSNAIALASPHPDDIDEYTRSWTAQYGWGPLNLSFPGQWGARLANRIADDTGIPVAIFNGAVGASKIADLLPMPGDPAANYSQLLTRMEQAGTGKRARAAFFFQGEADGWETSIADYKTRFLALKNAWKADYGTEHAWLFQMRYQSCTAEKPLVMEAQRQLGLENTDIDALSTTNADHDSCHFFYEKGYKLLGDRLFALVANKFYGKAIADADPPDVSKVYFENPVTLVAEFSNAKSLSVTGWPWGDWRTEGTALPITGGSVAGNKVRLSLAAPQTGGATGLTYLGHPGNAPHWLTGPAGVGMLTFFNKEISAAPPQPLPDFLVSSVALAASVQAGGSATISFSIKNAGATGGASMAVGAWLSSDNSLSANDLSLATAALAQPPAGATATGSMLLTIPAATAPGPYFIILKIDPAAQIAEANEANNELASPISVSAAAPPLSGPDLELAASAPVLNPAAWATATAVFTLKNTGGATATGISVALALDGKLVYEGGNEYTASVGSFNYLSGVWAVGTLGAGQSAAITVRLFMLDTLPKRIFGQVTAQAETDPDSQPANGNHLTGPAQDDEAWLKFNNNSAGGGGSGGTGGNNGGGNPLPAGPCRPSSDFPWEDWIAGVEIGSGLAKTSGKAAYSDFTATAADLPKNTALPVKLTAGFSYFGFPENWRIWLDADRDDIFSPSEILLEAAMAAPADGAFSKVLTGQLTIPATADDGPARLRVAMSRGQFAGPCDTLDFGEFEDFLVNITPALDGPDDPRSTFLGEKEGAWFALSPNPAGDFAVASMPELLGKPVELRVTDALGKTIFYEKTERAGQSVRLLDCRGWQNGLYFVRLETSGFRPVTRRLVVSRTF